MILRKWIDRIPARHSYPVMKKFLSLALLIGTLLFLASASFAQSLTGSIGSGSIVRGGSAKGTITLTIPSGLHVNSHRPNSEFAIPTVVKLNAKGIKLGAVSYPRGKSQKFEFSDKPISVYEGRVGFRFNVAVPRGYKAKLVKVRALVTFQACTNEVCYAPKTKEIVLTAKVK